MNIIDADYDIVHFCPRLDVYRICLGYSVCYNVKVPDTFEKQCEYIRRHREHGSQLEHSSMSVIFTINRGISHELVRHRHTAFGQQSTRYCSYDKKRFGNQLTFIKNSHFIENSDQYYIWIRGLENAEHEYLELLKSGMVAEEARGCLPNDISTKLLVTTNFREWRRIFELRCDSHAHYQMREIMRPLYDEVNQVLPCIFDDIRWSD